MSFYPTSAYPGLAMPYAYGPVARPLPPVTTVATPQTPAQQAAPAALPRQTAPALPQTVPPAATISSPPAQPQTAAAGPAPAPIAAPSLPTMPEEAPGKSGMGLKQELLLNTGVAYAASLLFKTAVQLYRKESLKAVLPWTLGYGTIAALAFNIPALMQVFSNKKN